MKTERVQTYLAVFEEGEDGGYSVSVPALPGCFSQGDTFEEARKNVEEAIRLYLDDADEDTKAYLRFRRGEVVTPVIACANPFTNSMSDLLGYPLY